MKNDFLGQNLKLIRLFHGLSLQELGEKVGCSRQYLSRLESGIEQPTIALENSLAESLLVLPDFFYHVDPMPIAEDQCHFRKQLTTKITLKQQARAKGEIFKRLVCVLEDNLELPKYNFLQADPIDAESIELAAEASRHQWGLGLGPISNMTRVAENAGAVIIKSYDLASEIDAISFATRRPVITINSEGKSACRSRFGIAHEVGHLTLHIGTQTGDKLTESQANRFASALLMPRAYFIKECKQALRGNRFSWHNISRIKQDWGVSKAAILYRGRQLGVFSEDQYKSGVIYLTRHGEAIEESEDEFIAHEEPEIISDGLKILDEHYNLSKAAIARSMLIHPAMVRLLFDDNINYQPASSNNVVSLFSSVTGFSH